MLRDYKRDAIDRRNERIKELSKEALDHTNTSSRLRWEEKGGLRTYRMQVEDECPKLCRGELANNQLKKQDVCQLYCNEHEEYTKQMKVVKKPVELQCLRDMVSRLKQMRRYKTFQNLQTRCRTGMRPCFDPRTLSEDILKQIEEKNDRKCTDKYIDGLFHNIVLENEQKNKKEMEEKEREHMKMEQNVKEHQLQQIAERGESLRRKSEIEARDDSFEISLPIGGNRKKLTSEEKFKLRLEARQQAEDHANRVKMKENMFRVEMGYILPEKKPPIPKTTLIAQEQGFLNVLACQKRSSKRQDKETEEMTQRAYFELQNLQDERSRIHRENREKLMANRTAYLEEITY